MPWPRGTFHRRVRDLPAIKLQITMHPRCPMARIGRGMAFSRFACRDEYGHRPRSGQRARSRHDESPFVVLRSNNIRGPEAGRRRSGSVGSHDVLVIGKMRDTRHRELKLGDLSRVSIVLPKVATGRGRRRTALRQDIRWPYICWAMSAKPGEASSVRNGCSEGTQHFRRKVLSLHRSPRGDRPPRCRSARSSSRTEVARSLESYNLPPRRRCSR